MKHRLNRTLRPLPVLALLHTLADGALAQEVRFNEQFLLEQGPTGIDVSQFNKGNVATPGQFRADLYVNDGWRGRITLRMDRTDDGSVAPCFDRDLVERIGVDLTRLAPDALALIGTDATACVPLPRLVAGAKAAFDGGELRLDVSVPQASLARTARDYVDPKYWDDGVPAAMLQYNANVWRSNAGPARANEAWLGINGGLNLGAWRFRHLGSLAASGGAAGMHYQNIQTSVARSVAAIRSQLVIGDAFTDGTMFDSVGFRGVQLASDERMYPDSQRGFAPVIRGIAMTHARVQVLQNGNLLYEMTVAPGPFQIDDLYVPGFGGNLSVVVTEADGTQTVTLVPYAAAPNALRPGVTHYGVTLGQYRSASIGERPTLVVATLQHGFTNLLTGYGGLVNTTGYVAAIAGVALNTPFGAFSLDLTQADASLPGQPSRNGQSVRLNYGKYVERSQTSVSMMFARTTRPGYLGLQDAVAMRATGRPEAAPFAAGQRRDSLQLTLNQGLAAGWGSLYMTSVAQDSWDHAGRALQFQAGYSNAFRFINYGLTFSRQYDQFSAKWDNRMMLNLSIPLGRGVHAPISSTSVQYSGAGAMTVRETVAGTLGADNALAYSVNGGYDGGGTTQANSSGGASLSYRSPVSSVALNASKGSRYEQYGASASGSVVGYGGGVVFSPSSGDTLAIVEAADAAGAAISTQGGVRVNRWGRALVSGLVPFTRNAIELDPKGLPLSVDLKATGEQVVPSAGAVVRVRFETSRKGTAAIIRARTADGQPLPFGAAVVNEQGEAVGLVAQGSRVIAQGLKTANGTLSVSWSEGAATRQCWMNYALPVDTRVGTPAWTSIDGVCAGRR